jgi:predicted Zn-dependent protease
MKRASMVCVSLVSLAFAWASASLCGSVLAQEPPPDAPVDSNAANTPSDEQPLEQRRSLALLELATLLELGLTSQLVAYGTPLVEEGGLLADHGRAVAWVARALFDSGRESDAEKLLTGAHVDASTGGAIELEWARIELTRDQIDRALARLVDERGRPRLVNEPAAWMLTGRALARRGQLAPALPYLRRFVELAPFDQETVGAFHLMHLEAAERGERELAAQLLAESQRRRRVFEVIRARSIQVRAAPGDPTPLYGLGLAFLELGDCELAAAVLTRLLTEHPEFHKAWFQLGEARRLCGDKAGALAAFDEGVARDANDHRCRLNRALLRIATFEADSARRDFEHLRQSEIASDPQYSAIYLGLARLYLLDGDEKSSGEAYAKYRELGGTENL